MMVWAQASQQEFQATTEIASPAGIAALPA